MTAAEFLSAHRVADRKRQSNARKYFLIMLLSTV
jgi:hypothetical protein